MLPLIRKTGCFVLGFGFGLYIHIPRVIHDMSENDLKTIEILSPFVLIFCGILLNGTYTKGERLRRRAGRESKLRNLRRRFGSRLVSRLEKTGWTFMVLSSIFWFLLSSSPLKHYSYFFGCIFITGYLLVLTLCDHYRTVNFLDICNIYSKPAVKNSQSAPNETRELSS